MSRSCLALSTRVLGSMLLGVVPSVNYSITLCALEIRVCTPSGVFNIQLLGILLFSNHLAKSVLPIMASCLSQSPASHKIRAPFPPVMPALIVPRATACANYGASAVKRMVFVKKREQKQGKESQQQQAHTQLHAKHKKRERGRQHTLEQGESEGCAAVPAH